MDKFPDLLFDFTVGLPTLLLILFCTMRLFRRLTHVGDAVLDILLRGYTFILRSGRGVSFKYSYRLVLLLMFFSILMNICT